MENLERSLKQSDNFHLDPTCRPVQFSNDEIELVLPTVEGCLLIPDISPCTISRYEVDRPLNDLGNLHMPDYPPRRKITIEQQETVPSMQMFELQIVGFSEEIKFPIILRKLPANSPARSIEPAQDPDKPTLDPEHLEQLATVVTKDAKNKWKDVGKALGFALEDLDDIERTKGKDGDHYCFQELLKRWLKRAPPAYPFPHVKHLAGALRAAEEHRTAYVLEHSKNFQ